MTQIAVEADHDRQPSGHRRRLVAADVLQPAHVPLDVRAAARQRVEVLVGAPAQEDLQVGLGVQPGLAAVAAQVRGHRRLAHTCEYGCSGAAKVAKAVIPHVGHRQRTHQHPRRKSTRAASRQLSGRVGCRSLAGEVHDHAARAPNDVDGTPGVPRRAAESLAAPIDERQYRITYARTGTPRGPVRRARRRTRRRDRLTGLNPAAVVVGGDCRAARATSSAAPRLPRGCGR